MKKLLSLMALFVVSLLMVSMVSAGVVSDADSDKSLLSDGVGFGTVRVNGDYVDVSGSDSDSYEVLAVEEGQTLNVRVGVEAALDVNDVEVEARISGYEYSDYENLEDYTHLFNVDAGTTKYVDLEVTLPNKLDKEVYWLRLRILNSHSESVEKVVKLSVEPTRHGVDIADVSFSPGNTVKAGRALLTTVLLENFGLKDEKDVKVTVAMPEFGVSATEFVDVVVNDKGDDGLNRNVDYEDVPEMFIQIPATAVEGDYEVLVTVKYDDLRETVTDSFTVHVLPNEMFQASEKLVLAVGPEAQVVGAGQSATYAVALTNAGTTSQAYMIEAVAGDWATISVSESFVVLEAGKNKVVYVTVAAAQNAVAGEHVASVAVKSGTEVLQTVALRATVVAGSGDQFNLRNGLEIALIVLVVLLVIVGLIVGFSRLRKDDEEEDQTYY